MKTYVRGALAYLIVTFPLAFFWHLVVFKGVYDELGMYREHPIVTLGFIAILIQGLFLSYAFPLVYRGPNAVQAGVKFGLLMGLFLWSSQVIAAAAKHEVSSFAIWFGIETAYFVVQFAIVGLALGLVYRAKMQEA